MRSLIAALIFCFSISTAFAHKHGSPELDAWFESLHNRVGGACCLNASKEARVVEDPDYEGTQDGGYIVHLDGKEIKVTPQQVVPGPNKYGPALAWPKGGGDGVWCFLPGA